MGSEKKWVQNIINIKNKNHGGEQKQHEKRGKEKF